MKIVTFVPIVAAALTVSSAAAQQPSRPSYRREVPARLVRQAKVAEDSALKVAQARIPSGTVQALELENEAGRLIWSFEFKVGTLPGIYEVNVDAKDGSLVGRVEHELPSAEHHDTARSGAKPRP